MASVDSDQFYEMFCAAMIPQVEVEFNGRTQLPSAWPSPGPQPGATHLWGALHLNSPLTGCFGFGNRRHHGPFQSEAAW